MNEDPQGFTPAPFPPIGHATPPLEDPPAKKRGGRRGPRKAKPEKPARNGRRKQKAKKPGRAPPVRRLLAETESRTVAQPGLKVDLATALAAFRGLSGVESQALTVCWVNLAGLTKQEIARVLAVLGKVTA